MKSLNKTLIALTLLAPTVPAFGEQPTNTQARLARLSALRALEVYENYSSLTDDESEENIRYIFNNDSLKIYNDLLGQSIADSISVDQYIDFARDLRGVLVTLSNISGGKIEDGGDQWIVPISFEKEILYTTQCGAIISTSEYYGDNKYRMKALVGVNKETDEAHILSLTGTIDSSRAKLAPGFALATKNDSRDEKVTNNGEKLVFNKFDQAFLSKPVNLEYADDDDNMKFVTSGEGDCETYSFSYHPTRWRVMPYYELALGGIYKVDAPENLTSTTSGMSLGVDFGFVIPSRSKFKVGIFTGVGFKTGKIDLNAAGIDYHYDADANADMDGDTYVRYYELRNIQQSVKLTHFAVPIYVNLDYRINRRVSVFANIGVKTYFDTGSKVENFSADVYSYGIYPQYQDLRMDESWLNAFGNATVGLNDVTNHTKFNAFSADILAGIGARVKLIGQLSLDLALNYMVPIIEPMETNDAQSLPSGSASTVKIPIQYTVAGGQIVENTLLDYCKVKSNPLRLKFGLIYKF